MEPPPYRLSVSHSSTREDEFLSIVGNPNHSEETATSGFHPLLGLSTMMGNPNYSESDTFTPLSGNPNHSEETATKWVSHPTRPFHSNGKSKPFGVGHLYSIVGRHQPLGVENPTFARSVDGKSKPLRVTALTRGVATHSRLLKSFRG